MGLVNSIKANIVKTFVQNVAKSNDHKTTLLGAVAAGVLATQIDFSKLMLGDKTELSKAVGAVVLALLGYYTNKPDASPAPEK